MLDVVFDVALVTLKQKKSEMVVILINKSIALGRKSDKKKKETNLRTIIFHNLELYWV